MEDDVAGIICQALMVGPTILNCVKWQQIGREEEEEAAASR